MSISGPFQYEIEFEEQPLEKEPILFSRLDPQHLSVQEQQHVIRLASQIILENFQRGEELKSPNDVRESLKVLLADRKDEVFCMLFLDSKNRILAFDELFYGTIDSTSVHPRVIVRSALELNASAGILVHNHPSGSPEPSQADGAITQRIKDALQFIDVRVLDHIVVASEGTISLAERGML